MFLSDEPAHWRFTKTSPTLPAVLRLPILIAVATLALAAGTAFGSTPQGTARTADAVTLWAKARGGPWSKTLSFRLSKLKLSVFYLCATYGTPLARRADCQPSELLPSDTFLRIEQTPIERAQKRADSPGWGLVGMGPTKVIGVELSNEVTGDVYGTFKYRATVRDGDGKVKATSNRVTITWHR
jgi:hypothetical protein